MSLGIPNRPNPVSTRLTRLLAPVACDCDEAGLEAIHAFNLRVFDGDFLGPGGFGACSHIHV